MITTNHVSYSEEYTYFCRKLSYNSHNMQLLHTLQARKEKQTKRKEKKSY